jgi:hypothetical protein
MPVVLVIVIVLTTLVGVMSSDTLLAVRRSAADEGGRAAVAAAEVAVAEATALIEQGASADFSGSVAVADGSATYRAVQVGADRWDVTAEGQVAGARRALLVVLTRESRFPYAVFAAERLELRNPVGLVTGRVGTNGTIDVTGSSPGSSQDLFRPSGACSGCGAPVLRDGPYRPAVPVIPATSQPCPAGGRFEGAVQGAGGVPYLCADPARAVSFGPVTVANGPLVVVVGPGVALDLTGASINVGGAPDQFRLYVLEDPSSGGTVVGADDANVAGLLHLPDASVTTDRLTVVGSIVVGRLTVAAGGMLSVTHHPGVAGIARGPWSVAAWAETAVG